ncbi:MAG: DUF1800 domain-containing protein [Verrucomicrobiota bacterium]|nr:DUF1800 domain-containing protein [Verrucomicrobiota bacterium]
MLIGFEPKKWDLSTAAHLLNRAGFGGTPESIAAFHALGIDGALQKLFAAPDDSALFPKPDWATPQNLFEMRMEERALSQEERRTKLMEERREQREHLPDLVSWWLNRMLQAENPFREKLTLFWHGHFATSVTKVRDCYLMWQQNETLRQNALGNFGALLKAVSRDPAMLVWLDTNQSPRGHPNENFARELLELFTLGIGNYTEKDVKEAARAFTGYKIDQSNEGFRFALIQHDYGSKTFLGTTGNFNGDDILDRILAQPACARFICKKLWEFFVYDQPSPAIVDVLAASFRQHKYEIAPLMRDIFSSAEFYSARAMRTQIKSPVQWLVSTAKLLELDLPPKLLAINALRQMGQVPFLPPSVKGWDGGKSWITTSTLLTRYNLAGFETGTGPMQFQRLGKKNTSRPGFQVESDATLPLEKIAPSALRATPEKLVENLSWRLFQQAPSSHDEKVFVEYIQANGTTDSAIGELVHLMMSTPQFQLT